MGGAWNLFRSFAQVNRSPVRIWTDRKGILRACGCAGRRSKRSHVPVGTGESRPSRSPLVSGCGGLAGGGEGVACTLSVFLCDCQHHRQTRKLVPRSLVRVVASRVQSLAAKHLPPSPASFPVYHEPPRTTSEVPQDRQPFSDVEASLRICTKMSVASTVVAGEDINSPKAWNTGAGQHAHFESFS